MNDDERAILYRILIIVATALAIAAAKPISYSDDIVSINLFLLLLAAFYFFPISLLIIITWRVYRWVRIRCGLHYFKC